jgi:cell division transport system permease protein
VRWQFLLNEVWTGFRRNVTMTVAMILTTAISIGLFGGALLVWRLADQSSKIYLSRVETQVFMDAGVSQHDPDCQQNPCRALRELLEKKSSSEVEHVVYLNPDKAYDDAISRVPSFKDFASRAAFPASFKVRLTNPENPDGFTKEMLAQPGVKGVLNQKDLIDKLFSLLYGVRDAVFAVALVQAVGAILLIANMVQVSAFNRRTEIGIMRLVGASRWYTQLPFLLEAMLAALIGVIIAVVGLLFVRAVFLESALKRFYDVPPPNPPLIARVDYLDVLYITPFLLLSVVIAGVAAYVTLRIYVRR